MARFNPPLPLLTTSAVRIAAQFTCNGQVYENVFDYISSVLVPPSSNAPYALGTAWVAANQTALLTNYAADVFFTGVFASDISAGLVPSAFIAAAGAPVHGGASAVSLPGTVAAVVTKNTAIRGQHGRGRTYLGPVPTSYDDVADTNRITAVAAINYAAYYTPLVTAPITAAGASWQLALTTRPVPPLTLVTHAAPVIGFNVRFVMGTVRRRREGRGQ